MKKLKLILAAAVLNIGFLACSSDDDNNSNPDLSCEEATEATIAAAEAYATATEENFVARCNAYKNALEDQIDACGDETGVIQDMIDGLDCTVESINGVISITVGASYTFEENITVITEGTTRKVTAYDNASDHWIYFEIEEGATGADVISNFNVHLGTSDYNPLPDDEGGNWSSNITVNSSSAINGTFFGIVTSPTTGADIDLTNGVIDLDL